MSDYASQIVQVRMEEVSARLSARMQKITDQTGIEFPRLFSQAVSRTATQAVSDSTGAEAAGEEGDASLSDVTLLGAYADPAFGRYDDIIERIAGEYGVSAALIRAMIGVESDYNAGLVSLSGAMGLMQLMPSTAAGLGVENALDPAQNIDGGVRYLLGQIIRYGGDVKTALAAYNAGPGGLSSRGVKDVNDVSQWALLPEETRLYLQKIQDALAAMGYGDLLDQNFFA